MNENNQLQQYPPEQQLPVNPETWRYLTPTQQGWLVFEQRKRTVFDELNRKELSIQAIPEGTGITEMEANLAAWRKGFSELKAMRLENWTRMIDAKLIAPSMEFEKRADPSINSTYITRDTKLLEMKKAERQRYAETAAKQQEIAEYTAHVKTQREWQVMELRKIGFNEISVMYQQALTLDEPHTILNGLLNTLSGLSFPPGQRFPRRLVPDSEAQAIMNTIPSPGLQAIRTELVNQARDVFANWENDKAAGTGNQSVEALSEAAKSIETDFQQSAAVNTLVAASQSVPVVQPEGKAIKKTYRIVEVNSRQWLVNVVAAFIRSNEPQKYIKAKTMGAVTVNQMAAALAAYASNGGDMVAGLQYEEVEK